MGDRVSISFKNGREESVALFSHWGGMSFVREAEQYVKKLKKWAGKRECEPLERLEPDTVMVDFIREITKEEEKIKSGIYLGKDEWEGDNSDNGHHVIDLTKGERNGKQSKAGKE